MIAGLPTEGYGSFLFCGGGTGGHLTPGLSVAQVLSARLPNARIVFAGTGRGRENAWVRRYGFEFRHLWASPWGKTPWRAARFAVRTTGGLFGAMQLEREIQPEAVIGLGGYASLAPGLVAATRNLPLILLEQNAYPGKANRLLSRWSKEICCAWKDAIPHFKRPDRARVTGNPIRAELRVGSADAQEWFGLSAMKLTLLVMGGSQGAAAINSAVAEALPVLRRYAGWLQILHATGEVTYERVKRAYRDTPIQHAVLPFIEDMAAAYSAADFVLCRAGGTSLAEITAAGLPSALVPLPIAANDHQTANAKVLERAGAALLVPQNELTPERIEEMAWLMRDTPKLRQMAAASWSVGVPDAAEVVANRILQLVGLGAARLEPARIRRNG